jgi:hypothetical protein
VEGKPERKMAKANAAGGDEEDGGKAKGPMTDQEINQMIAEACGWTGLFVATGKEEWLGTFAYEYEGKLLGFHSNQTKDDHAHEIPRYYNDLNAMHDAWDVGIKNSGEDEAFCRQLRLISCPDKCDCAECSYVVNATARQRAEAFLRTLGKWKDQ